MFGLVSKKAYDSLALDLECERVHFKKEIQAAYESAERAKTENACLKIANRELVKKLGAKEQMLSAATDKLFDLQLMVKSLEARWGQEAHI